MSSNDNQESDVPLPTISGDIELPPNQSGHIVIDKPKLFGSKTKKQDNNLTAKQELFERIRNYAQSVCPLEGENCQKISVRAHMRGETEYDQLGSPNLKGDTATVLHAIPTLTITQKDHLADYHPEYCSKLILEWKESVTHMWLIEKVHFELATVESKLRIHQEIGPAKWEWGPDAWKNKLKMLEVEQRRLEANWFELLNLEKDKQHLKQIGEETRREINERLELNKKAEQNRKHLIAKGLLHESVSPPSFEEQKSNNYSTVNKSVGKKTHYA